MILSLIDRILGKPTQESVAKQLAALMQAKGATDIRFDASQGSLHYVNEAGNGMTNVMSIYREVLSVPRSQRQAAVQRYFDGVYQMGDQLPNSYEEALTKLLPVVRTRTEIALNELRIDALGDLKSSESVIPQRQLTENLCVLLVIDLPTSMNQVTSSQLKNWGVTFDQALTDALNNLRKITDESKWVQAADGVWVGQWNDSYESSRLLLPDLIYRLGISEPVAMAPFRNALFVTSAGNTEGIDQIAQFVVDNYEGPRKHLSFEVLELKDKDWQTATKQPQSMANTRVRDQHGSYELQKALLQQHYAKQGEDVFIATFNGLQKNDGAISSYAVWSKNVDTFLPKVDMVFFIDQDDEAKRLQLAWETVTANFADLMEPTSYNPPRWRVRTYPDDEVLTALAEKAA